MDLPSSLIQHRVSQHVLDTITWTGHRLLPDCSLRKGTHFLILTSFMELSIRRQRFICIYLYKSHLTNLVRLFLRRSRPISFDFSRLRQFVISSYQPIPRGLPSSFLRHGYFISKASVVSQCTSFPSRTTVAIGGARLSSARIACEAPARARISSQWPSRMKTSSTDAAS